ncbi:DsbA family oxidoreductase [Nitrospira lenta]|uniref:Putative thiol oxidoreductase, DsbA family, FrnE subfamily n=1 Tax=Nitrospira lenta TaxID=1436998 RepID=A0A330L6G3_9BACT|nr:DsbA family oxidoreductase [Nitrospira lenta]SPP64525.1 putative thiol oxidoreductase, DsbA family, FrnE subfamily [Nitrospira lenta]
MTAAPLRIEIYSDVVCPWCYVGKRRLERALMEFDGDTRITWRPFQLNPTLPEDGMDRTAYLEAKFGSREAFRRLEEQVLAAGSAEQIPFAFDKIARTPKTFLAHRLIWFAEREGRQDAVVDSLFRGYFEEGADIGGISVLVDLAGRAGLDRESVARMLQSDEGAAEVKAEEATGRTLGIRGVPYFIMNGTSAISGAQPSDRFVEALKQVQSLLAR